MKKERTLLFLGIWVALLPNLGFPENWRKILFLLTGLFIIFISYIMYRSKIRQRIMMSERSTNDVMHTFAESEPEPESDITEEVNNTEEEYSEIIKEI